MKTAPAIERGDAASLKVICSAVKGLVQLPTMVKTFMGNTPAERFMQVKKMNFKNTLRNDSYYNSNFPVRINKEQQED